MTRINVLCLWADGRREMTQIGGLSSDLIMPVPVPNSGGGWRPAVFAREIVEYPDGWHGPFESDFWYSDDGVAHNVRMVRYREVRP